MIIAFTAQGTEMKSPVDPRFGRSSYFILYDEKTDQISIIDNTEVDNLSHGAGPKTAQKLIEAKVDILITGNGPGGNAARVLKETGIRTYTGAGEMSVEEAFRAYNQSKLKEFTF